MTGHDLDPLSNNTRAAVEERTMRLAAESEVESLRAKLAAAEQERDAERLIAEQALGGNVDPVDVIAAIVGECQANRAALAAVRELPHEDWCCGDGCANPYHRAGCSDCYCWKSDVEAAITAAAEQPEPTPEQP